MLLVIFESVALLIVEALVRSCFVFWSNQKFQGQDIGKFLGKGVKLKFPLFNKIAKTSK